MSVALDLCGFVFYKGTVSIVVYVQYLHGAAFHCCLLSLISNVSKHANNFNSFCHK